MDLENEIKREKQEKHLFFDKIYKLDRLLVREENEKRRQYYHPEERKRIPKICWLCKE